MDVDSPLASMKSVLEILGTTLSSSTKMLARGEVRVMASAIATADERNQGTIDSLFVFNAYCSILV